MIKGSKFQDVRYVPQVTKGKTKDQKNKLI